MGIWIIMLISCLLLPVMMLGIGSHFAKNPPPEINPILGYRTKRSMLNKETWDFAHRHCGKIWLLVGKVLLLFSCIAMLFVLGKDENLVRIYGAVISIIQIITLLGSIIPTEVALKKIFDENGNRIR